jgi:hypothetical protein
MSELELSREEFYHALNTISVAVDRGFERVNNRLDAMNGQVREHGEDIAVLQDRGSRDMSARWGAVGNGAATAAVALWALLQK